MSGGAIARPLFCLALRGTIWNGKPAFPRGERAGPGEDRDL